MPTDLSVAVAQSQTERLSGTQDMLLVALPAAVGVISAVLALQSPVVASALVLVGMQ